MCVSGCVSVWHFWVCISIVNCISLGQSTSFIRFWKDSTTTLRILSSYNKGISRFGKRHTYILRYRNTTSTQEKCWSSFYQSSHHITFSSRKSQALALSWRSVGSYHLVLQHIYLYERPAFPEQLSSVSKVAAQGPLAGLQTDSSQHLSAPVNASLSTYQPYLEGKKGLQFLKLSFNFHFLWKAKFAHLSLRNTQSHCNLILLHCSFYRS